jgi:hypothetical protein
LQVGDLIRLERYERRAWSRQKRASFKGVLKTASFTQLSPASPDVVFSKLCSTNSDATY